MLLSELLNERLIQIGTKATTKVEVIEELVELLYKEKLITNPDEIIDLVLTREAEQSTGLGRNIAIPHTRVEGLEKICCSLIISKEGISFNSIDHSLAKLIFLILTPPLQTKQHILALETIALLSMNEEYKEKLINSKTSEEAMSIIKREEELE
ncbi:MAG TPA: PTS sugar transporter subunit IIA [bacterium]|nr:PTS sugar transporter subunit IIA [bacterium]HOL47384.1 PTS sugar transporter subunit IIA [bacterium]HPQ18117.1 PTS sugar transporter subunit IIA [bacterium]